MIACSHYYSAYRYTVSTQNRSNSMSKLPLQGNSSVVSHRSSVATVSTGVVLLLAVAISFVLWLVPGASLVLLPLRPFVAFVHETWHAVVAVLTGGHVKAISILGFTGNGYTLTTGGNPLLIASAGYVGSALTGGVFLALLPRPNLARIATVALFIVLGVAGILWNHNLAAWLYLVCVGAVLYAAVRFLSDRVFVVLLGILALQLNLQVLEDLRYLLALSAATKAHSDALVASQLTGLPPLFWALLWSAVSLALLAGGLFVGLRSSPRRAARAVARLTPS
ncbi:MAG: M50 family metallopeptidase [Chloroflexi bacterium]|nr:M50 family metallopeptidase [Chloroflexota bacterium]